MLRSYKGQMPRIAASAYIDPQAVVIGDVEIGEDSSVWPCAVIRGDVHYIRIGARTNIQDGSILHVMRDTNPLVLGDDVTVGHSVTLHGCTIESRCLIGMGSIILNGAVIGTGSIIAAGTLVPERTIVPPGSLMMGQPGQAAPRARALKISIRSTRTRAVTSSTRKRIAPRNGRRQTRRQGTSVARERQFRAIKGTRDILPPDSKLWNWFEQTAQEVFGTYGFGDIRARFSKRRSFLRGLSVRIRT